jgi:uncharacterized protein YjbI with pentapeptide repeats
MGKLRIWYRDNALPYITRCWTYIVKNKWTIIVSVGVIILILVCCDYEDIANFFFDKNPNGEFLKVLLSVAGGVGIYYGLWINQKRIGEQNRQNNIVESSNSDKRYSDAVGYLGSDNSTSILGGVYTLYQLAKEDKRYRPIVANLLCSYLRGNCEKLYAKDEENERKRANSSGYTPKKVGTLPIIMQTIIDILFNNEDSTFDNEILDLSGIHLIYARFNGDIINCNFDFAVLEYCIFIDKVCKSKFELAQLLNCQFYSSIYSCNFNYSYIEECKFGKLKDELESLKNCYFNNSKIKSTNFYTYSFELVNFCTPSLHSVHFYVDRMKFCRFDFLVCEDVYFDDTTFENTTILNNLDQVHYVKCVNAPNL